MPERRLDILKTYKLLIDGKFVRSESGRSLSISDHSGEVLGHVCHGSRKDLREAVEAAFRALATWSGMTAYNRGQIIYRMAEMLQSRRQEFADLLRATVKQPAGDAAQHAPKKPQRRRRIRPLSVELAREEVDLAVDRLVCFAGWADKFSQVLGCNNPVAGPYYNFTIPEPTGIVGVISPDEPALLGLISLIAPPLCAGNTVIALTSDAHPLCGLVFAEVCATSDVPAGAVNVLSTRRGELIKPLAEHREVGAISAANVAQDHATALRMGAAENLKRVSVVSIEREAWSDASARHSPWTIEPFIEMKTIWHPSAT
jgi:acyl-CoA reductase-like NAD-dependent aldehyde dehydrogenase